MHTLRKTIFHYLHQWPENEIYLGQTMKFYLDWFWNKRKVSFKFCLRKSIKTISFAFYPFSRALHLSFALYVFSFYSKLIRRMKRYFLYFFYFYPSCHFVLSLNSFSYIFHFPAPWHRCFYMRLERNEEEIPDRDCLRYHIYLYTALTKEDIGLQPYSDHNIPFTSGDNSFFFRFVLLLIPSEGCEGKKLV